MSSCNSFLTPLYEVESIITPQGRKEKVIMCKCELCGSLKTIRANNLSKTKSCGCAKNKFIGKANRTHGESKTRLYRIWSLMKDRCTNKNAEHYNLYGGRGITVCNEWLHYEPFKQWALKSGYKKHLSIDRINNDKGYAPDNCRWVTKIEQANNKRNNIRITHNEETLTLGEWAARLHMEPRNIWWRIHTGGWNVSDAVSIPKGMHRNNFYIQRKQEKAKK